MLQDTMFSSKKGVSRLVARYEISDEEQASEPLIERESAILNSVGKKFDFRPMLPWMISLALLIYIIITPTTLDRKDKDQRQSWRSTELGMEFGTRTIPKQ